MRRPYIVGTPRPYPEDSGVDVLMPVDSPVIAVGNGFIIYSEGVGGFGKAHTPWIPTDEYPNDTPGCILLRLDVPVQYGSRSAAYFWYAHLSKLAYRIRDGIDAPRRVAEGMMIGHSGTGRGIPHLHCNLLFDRKQGPNDYIAPFEALKLMQTWKTAR